MAMMLLTLTCLSFPSLCQGEALVPFTSPQAVDEFDDDGSVPDASDEGCGAECFCCCLRIRPQPIVRGIEAPMGGTTAIVAEAPITPLLRTASLFHPPRQ